jgi:hypothetical protein
MARNNALRDLHAEYAQITNQNPSTWTEDERTSLAYYRADIAMSTQESNDSEPYAIRQWIEDMHQLDAFYRDHNRFPRKGDESNRASRDQLRHLVIWVDTQRRAIRAGRRSTYQRRRLETVPGFIERSHDGVWMAQFESYRRYIDTHPGAPSYRSRDARERANANWAAKQRAAAKRGTLPDDRAERLKTLRIWA